MDKPISILIIDDEPAMLKILENELTLDRFRVYTAQNGREGFELAKNQKPDVILLDWIMPEIDGLQVLYELRRCKVTKRTPVFMLTARSRLDDINRAYSIGADDYIIKPFKVAQINNIIKCKLKKLSKRRNVFWRLIKWIRLFLKR